MDNLDKYLEIFGIKHGEIITEGYVKSKYRVLAKKYHPDLGNSDSMMFIELTKAKEYLLNNLDIINVIIKISDENEKKFVFTSLNLFDFSLAELDEQYIDLLFERKRGINNAVKLILKYKGEKFIVLLGVLNQKYGDNENVYIRLVFYLIKIYLCLVDFDNVDFKFINKMNYNVMPKTISDDDLLYLILKIYISAIFDLVYKNDLNKNTLLDLYTVITKIYESPLYENFRTSTHYMNFMKRKIEEEMHLGGIN